MRWLRCVWCYVGFVHALRIISPGRHGAGAHCGWKTVREVSRGVNPFGENRVLARLSLARRLKNMHQPGPINGCRLALGRAGHRHRQAHRPLPEAASALGVPPLPGSDRAHRAGLTGSPSGAGQPGPAQNSEGRQVIPHASAVSPALPAAPRRLAQPGGTLVRADHRATHPAWGVQKRRGTHRRQQPESETLRLDRHRRTHPGSRRHTLSAYYSLTTLAEWLWRDNSELLAGPQFSLEPARPAPIRRDDRLRRDSDSLAPARLKPPC